MFLNDLLDDFQTKGISQDNIPKLYYWLCFQVTSFELYEQFSLY